MLSETLILALTAGLLSGGRIRNLLNIRIVWPGLIFAGLTLRNLPVLLNRVAPQVFRLPFLTDNGLDIRTIAATFFVASYIFLIAGVVVNIRGWPMAVMLAGILMNFIVIVQNGGFMPVSINALENAGFPMTRIVDGLIDLNHIVETDQTRLMVLADIIPVTKPYPFQKMLSVGDLFLCLGLYSYLYTEMRTYRPTLNRPLQSLKRHGVIDKLHLE